MSSSLPTIFFLQFQLVGEGAEKEMPVESQQAIIAAAGHTDTRCNSVRRRCRWIAYAS
jgi:hypothetical protein